MVKHFTLLCLLFFVVFISYGGDYKTFFNNVKENNTSIRISEINNLIARKNYEKAIILARSGDEKLKAEITLAAALVRYTPEMNAVHKALFSLILDAAIKDTEYKILEFETKVAFLDYQYAQLIDDLSYFKDITLVGAFIEYKEKELELRQSDWEKKEAQEQFKEYTNSIWDQQYLELAKEFSFTGIKENDWTEHDPSIKLLRLQSELTEYELKNLPGNASKYDSQIKKLEAEKARMEYEKAITGSLSGFRKITQELDFTTRTLALIKENKKAYEGEIRDAENRFKKKLIPEKELLQKRIYAATLEKNYYIHLKNYITLLIEYISGSGKKPEEILK
ncbi:MAG: hypothetical protein JXB88_04105 [Spirochaetales bacterium]|nr:hypothetical protein [Spirochaetales bacterium]